MNRLVRDLVKGIPAVFESDEYQHEVKRLGESFKARRDKLINSFEKKLAAQEFKLIQVQMGPFFKMDVLPVIENQPTQIWPPTHAPMKLNASLYRHTPALLC